MDNPVNTFKVQLRLQKCQLFGANAPTQYAFSLNQTPIRREFFNHELSLTQWRSPQSNIIRFNCFLVLILQNNQASKCYLQLFSRCGGVINLIGTVSLAVYKSRQIKKYIIKQGKDVKASIQLSIYKKNKQQSLPIIDRVFSEISAYSNYNSVGKPISLDFDSFLSRLKPSCDQDHHNLDPKLKEKSKKMAIQKTFDVMLNEQNFDLSQVQDLLTRLFEQISKKNAEIYKKEAQLIQKQAEIKHIKMKELIFQKDQKKRKVLKKQTQFLLAANEVLTSKDQKYEEQYRCMKEQKTEMEAKISTISAESALKIASMKHQLDLAKKKLNSRQKKLESLNHQLQIYTNETIALKKQNQYQLKVINNLKNEINSQDNRKSRNIATQLINQFSLCLQREDSCPRQTEREKNITKCQFLSLFNKKQLCFQENNNCRKESGIQIPNIISYLLNFNHSQ